MAAFCQQCSINLFGEDFKELAGVGVRKELCENCGWVLVDADGKRVKEDN